jgi:CO/xanthine dehydrogenase Mo-binding subunit
MRNPDTTDSNPPELVSRRKVLQGTVAAALFLGLRVDGSVVAAGAAGTGRFSAFLEITPGGAIRITTPSTELGQGVHSNLPRIVAEELDADWADVEVVMPHADAAFVSPITGRHRTASSESVKIYYEQLRSVGAAAREMLCAAAAAQWSVPQAECVTGASRVRHPASGREASYSSLAVAASSMPVPAQPRKKRPEEFRLIGRPIARKDLPDKVSGKTVFGIDVVLPGMLHAALRMPSQVGAEVKRFDPDSVLQMPGVVAAVKVDGGVAVIADSFWQARKAADALDVEFVPGPAAGLDTETMRERLRAALDDDAAAVPFPDIDTQAEPPKMTPLDRGATAQALASAGRTLTLEYEVPYLTHLTLEPMVSTALVTADSCHLWIPSQQPDRGREAAAKITGLPLDKVRMDITFAGGGFGRKWELDFLRQSVQAAAAVPGRPVKLTWTREQDVQHDFYRPAYVARSRVALGDNGIAAMHSRLAGQSVWRFQGRPPIPGMADPTAASLLIYDLYDFPKKYIDYVDVPWNIPVGLWRSVTLSQNSFFAESAIDEAAAALGRDPYEFRYAMLERHPRIRKVLETAARRAGWDKPLPKGRGRGIALSAGFGSVCAQVVEVSVENRRLRVHRLTCAFDCGRQIDPGMVRAQIEGGMVFGLSAALSGGVTFRDGAVVESNFHDQPILRINETPEITVELIDSDAAPGGAGEASVPAVAPALTGAIFAATGERIRRLPLSTSGLQLA